ncbi:MAG: inositol monophosphatase [Puniceicoccaceae bacterium]
MSGRAEAGPPVRPDDWERIAGRLADMGAAVRDGIVTGRRIGDAGIHRVTAADTIYRIDKVGEDALLAWFENHWPAALPVDVIAEGLGDETGRRFPAGAREAALAILIDPIDGTRGLMYDKRPAWFLAGAAPAGGRPGRLRDLRAAAMVEIPTSRQTLADEITAWTPSTGAFRSRARRSDLSGGGSRAVGLRPSTAGDLRHGFASFANFFPEGRAEIHRIEDRFLRAHLPETPSPTPLVFNDQYISTGGQIHELISGRDRFVADLRPLVFRRHGLDDCLACHPYDLACLPVARASGCVFEDPWGGPLDAPLDTTTPVAWVGYANEYLAGRLRPLLRRALAECGYRE